MVFYIIIKPIIIINIFHISTDHDLTGQVVWPASLLLSTFLLCHKDSIFNESMNKNVLELGSGCGLGGYVAASLQPTSKVFLTDGNDIVVRLLEQTKAKYEYENVFVKKLLWGIKSEIISLGTYPNIIIGADVLLWPNHTRALLLTIKWLMISSYLHDNNSKPATYISYIVRANSTTSLLFKSADELGLKIEIRPLDFLPMPEPLCLQALDKMILKFTLLNTDNIDESNDTIEEETVKELGFASAPC